MAYVIGTDEAGYGPNLGPLVISATVWRVPSGTRADDLYRLLGSCVTQAPDPLGANHLRPIREPAPLCPLQGRGVEGEGFSDKLLKRVAIADSKALYQPHRGLRHLERGVFAALTVLGRRPTTWRQVWDALCGESAALWPSIPWYAHYDAPVPLDADPSEIEPLAESLRQGLAASSVELIRLRSKAVFPHQFNALVRQYGSKGEALSHTTLDLVARMVDPLGEEPISVVSDKHGGRNRYGRLVADHFPEALVEIHGEGRSRSVYRFGPAQRRVEIRFLSRAESLLPTALASMVSKYLRELAMRALNEFWCRRVDGLRPTAGYPQDAKRFKAQIAAAQAEMGIEDHLLWRCR